MTLVGNFFGCKQCPAERMRSLAFSLFNNKHFLSRRLHGFTQIGCRLSLGSVLFVGSPFQVPRDLRVLRQPRLFKS